MFNDSECFQKTKLSNCAPNIPGVLEHICLATSLKSLLRPPKKVDNKIIILLGSVKELAWQRAIV